jgi:hypothetical protein
MTAAAARALYVPEPPRLLLVQLAAKPQSALAICGLDTGDGYECRQLATVHHLETEQDCCIQHFDLLAEECEADRMRAARHIRVLAAEAELNAQMRRAIDSDRA